MERRRILVIAGSDSSGGAGLEADQKVIAAHGCYAMTATTALTAQNTQGVVDILVTPSSFVVKQIDACIDDVGVDIVKTGMLASAETVRALAAALRRHKVALTVIDPVCVSTSGHQLLPQEAIKTLREELFPISTIVTPNIPEAFSLLKDAGRPVSEIKSVDDLLTVARAVHELGPKYVLLKGGHLPFTKENKASSSDADRHKVVDVLVGENESMIVESDYIESRNTHGTGCSLASAIASNLVLGKSMSQAVRAACEYVEVGIRTSSDLGKGNGPINHFHSSYTLPFAPGHFIDHMLAREDIQAAWRDHTEHAFVAGMADGSLPLEDFKHYLIQDYIYLTHFARANALAAYKATSLEDINTSASLVTHITNEIQLHIAYCEEFGISKEEIEATEESMACTAYSRYILDVGASSDWFALQVAFIPCMLGYGDIGARLHADPATKREGNPYWKWIKCYVEPDYVDAVSKGRALLEKHAVKQSASRIEELAQVFLRATKMETGFWEMGSSGR